MVGIRFLLLCSHSNDHVVREEALSDCECRVKTPRDIHVYAGRESETQTQRDRDKDRKRKKESQRQIDR